MPIFQSQNFNSASATIPDVNIVVSTPPLALQGVNSHLAGIVGTASYGPVDVPTVIGTLAQYEGVFGTVQNRPYDAGTILATAALQGANNFVVVRVTDGTDVAASAKIASTALTVTSIYTGSAGNTLNVSISAGTKASTWKIIVAGLNGSARETFDNIGGTGQAFWTNAAQAINTGAGTLSQTGSQYVVASAGTSTTAPTAQTVYLTGGTDGATTISESVMVGNDSTPPSGMYALRGQGCLVAALADMSDPTSWSTQMAFAAGTTGQQGEGVYMILTGASGETTASAITNLSTAGIDSPYVKPLLGNYLYWLDTQNQIVRAVSPQGFVLGRLAALSPEQSGLNKPLNGVVGSQRTGLVGSTQQGSFTTAELLQLYNAGIDVVTNPIPAGAAWGLRNGVNSSSNAIMRNDAWPRLTQLIAQTLNAGMGQYVGRVINTQTFLDVTATLSNYLHGLVQSGVLALNPDGSNPYSVVCNASDNPQSSTQLGNLVANVLVTYQAIVANMDVFLQGGSSVVTTLTSN